MFSFDQYQLDPERRELRRDGQLVALEPQVFDLLVLLVENRDRVVSKDDLLEAIWSGRAISDSTMTSRINAARSAIGDSGGEQRRIRTISRKGFRFIGDVFEVAAVSESAEKQDAQKLPEKPSIAVLAFTNMSGDAEQDYFSDGMTEEITTALSRLRWLFVISRNSAFVYKGRAQDVRQIGAELGVRYILEGSVRKSGERVRVTCPLLDASAGRQIWSDRYDRDLTDIFAVQDEITSSVIGAIEPKLLAAEGLRAQSRQYYELDAWEEVARALSYFWRFTAADNAAAVATLRRVVQKHPDYAPAHSMLACALLISAYAGWTSHGSERDVAASHAYRALVLDDDDPWAHLGLGLVAVMGRLTDEAIRHFRAALDLNPNFATARGFVGFTLALDGRCADALVEFEQALRASPRDPFNSMFLAGTAVAHYLDGRFGEAATWARQAVLLRPEYVGGYRILAASLAQDGQRQAAEATVGTLQRLVPGISVTLVRFSVPYTERMMGRFVEGLRRAGLPE